MRNEPDDATLSSAASTMKIIALALILGVVAFSGVAIVLGWGKPANGNIVSLLGLGLVAVEMVPFFLVPAVVGASRIGTRADTTVDQAAQHLCGLYQTRMIVRYALIEGACFLNLIAYLTERNTWSLLVIGSLLTAMIFIFPTETRLRHWVEAQLMVGDR